MAEAPKAAPKHKDTTALADELQKRHERFTLFLFLEGAVGIVAGMFLISEFLSRGKADQTTVLVTSILAGLFVLGFAVTWFLRRRSDRAAQPA